MKTNHDFVYEHFDWARDTPEEAPSRGLVETIEEGDCVSGG